MSLLVPRRAAPSSSRSGGMRLEVCRQGSRAAGDFGAVLGAHGGPGLWGPGSAPRGRAPLQRGPHVDPSSLGSGWLLAPGPA